jgi:hypothetical protein
LLRGYAKPLQQIWKRLSEKKNQRNEMNRTHLPCTVTETRNAKHNFGPACGMKGEHFSRVCYKGMRLSLLKRDHGLCINDGTIIVACNFLKDRSNMWFVVGKMFSCCTDFYPHSSDVFIWKVSGLSDNHFVWPLDSVVAKVALIPHKHFFVCLRLLHT